MTLRDVIEKVRPATSPVPAGMIPADRIAAEARKSAAAGSSAPAASAADRELLIRRDRLTEQFTLAQAELGGIFYEMAIRDHVRLDVLTKKAAALQRIDAELAEVQRELTGEPEPVGAACSACGTRHAKAARFCSGCGKALAA